jgi:hypothetical protein
MEEIAKHLQLLDGKTRKQSFDILFNLGNISKDFRYLLSVCHAEKLRDRLRGAYNSIIVAPSSYDLKEAINLLIARPKKVTISQEIVYIIYKIVEGAITPSMYTNLQAALGYDIQWVRETKPLPNDLQACNICGKLNPKEVCRNCTSILEEFTEYRRDSFQVPINYFNFQGVSSGEFSMRYKDWAISRAEGSSEISFELLKEWQMEVPEQYPLPFEEYQKKILS